MSRRGTGGERGGFALAMVVLLLFAVGMAGATAYQVVRLEAELSIGGEEASEALDVAQAGLQRYLAESLGPPDTADYVVGSGSVTVTPRRLVRLDADTDLYLIRAEGRVSDSRYPGSPARRTVSAYARLHRSPVPREGALLAAYPSVDVPSQAQLNGFDAGACGGSDENIYGLVKSIGMTPSGTSRIYGAPAAYLNLTDNAAVVDRAGVRWDILQNPQQPMGRWDADWPDFGSLPADSFPVVRVTGDFNGQYTTGRGVLIVPGTFSVGVGGYFNWDGIVLAGSLGPIGGTWGPSRVDGMVLGGLDGGGTSTITVTNTVIRHDRCLVAAANRNIAYLEPLDATWWEGL